jgi:hypothetical protein
MLCPYGLRKGDLKLQNFKTPNRTNAMKKVGKKHSLNNVWQDSFVNAEPAVATNAVNSKCLLKSMQNADEQKSAIKCPRSGTRKSHSI